MNPSQPSSQLQDNQQSYYDQNAIQTLKQTVSLNNHQLLQLTYHDQKFYLKLKQLNHHGCLHIHKLQYTQALIYLTQAEKVLQYAASCGKTIERKLIITTLNNQASLYQKAWELEKAQSYLEAIIYNISSFFQNSSENQYADKTIHLNNNILDKNSPEHQDFSISLWRKKSLVIFYLQYCAINSQNKNNQRAFSSASKAVSLIKEVSMDFYRYEQYLNENKTQSDEKVQACQDEFTSKDLLLQLACFKQIDMKKIDFEEFYKKTINYIAAYMKRLQALEYEGEEKLAAYKKCFENYSIGTIMQINPIQLDQQTDKVNLDDEITMIQKHYKAIYLSVGHFILGTEARFIAAQKYTLDQNERRTSTQYKESQIYHLSSIIILTKFLLCESGYFDHIVNSLRNHYKLDILEDARKLLESDNLQVKDLENDPLFAVQITQGKISHQVEQINQCESDIKTVHEIPTIPGSSPVQNGDFMNLKTQQSQEEHDGPVTPKQKNSRNTKSTKLSKNTATSQNAANRQRNPSKQPVTAIKKSQKKYNHNNQLTKSQTRLQALEANRMTASQYQNKQQKNPNTNISKEKQNKIRNQLNQIVKSSHSKRKSQHQFMSSHKKIHLNHDKLGSNTKQRYDSRKQTIYSKRESDYGTGLSRSKHKRIPTSNETERKLTKRKDSFVELKKVKKTQNEYGMGFSSRNMEYKTSKDSGNTNVKGMKKTRNQMQSAQKQMKMTSPELKIKKLKSPRNNKK